MKTSLGKSELGFYFGSWITSNIFSLYHLFAVQEGIWFFDFATYDLLNNGTLSLKLNESEFKQGWTILSRYKDESDGEWITWARYLKISWLPLVIHFIGSEALRYLNRSLVKYWYIIFSLSFTFLKFGFRQFIVIISQPIIYMLILCTCGSKAKIIIWTVSIIILHTVHMVTSSETMWELMDPERLLQDADVYLIFLSLGWTQVRCISFCFDQISQYNVRKQRNAKIKIVNNFESQIMELLCYSLYFPTLLMGPILLYSDFEKSFIKMERELLLPRLRRAFINIFIIIVYSYMMDLALHYIYFLALRSDLTYVRMLPIMALCGAGLWMGVQFHLKYVIIYGMSGAFASLDHMEVPPTPRCILRIHLYSHMWKYFDVGLYRFLITYIYKPTFNAMSDLGIPAIVKKMIAALATFTFIFSWHGTTLSIFIWSSLNYIGVILETLGSIIGKTESYANFRKNILKTDRMEERFRAFVSAPLFIMSALSSFYLFADFDVGQLFVERLFSESWYNILFIYFCLYACCNVSVALSDVPSRTDRSK